MICLCPVFEKNSPDTKDLAHNPILKEIITKEDFYREKLLELTNRGALYRLDKCCRTIAILMTREETAKYYFNPNDISAIIDILLREAENN